MFGSNPSEPFLKGHDGLVLDVQETFLTMQGEGPDAGRRAFFIRLAGCHLQCYFCDTDFLSRRAPMQVSALTSVVEKALRGLANPFVVITGGEPMRQNIVPLCKHLEERIPGVRVQIETSGTLWLADVEHEQEFIAMLLRKAVTIVVSPKTPTVHTKVARYAHAWKYIIGADTLLSLDDGLPLSSTQHAGGKACLGRPNGGARGEFQSERVYVQPLDYGPGCEEKSAIALRACVGLVMRHGYRLSIQQHKLANMP